MRTTQQVDDFLAARRIFELASQARINEHKSFACILRGPGDASGDDLLARAPVSALEPHQREIVHLGYPIHLRGSNAREGLAERLAAIRTKIALLCHSGPDGPDILARVMLCMTFLLSKLWHSLS